MFRFSDQVWKGMQMGEVVTILTSASGHSLVKSFTGQDLSPQPFSTGKLFNIFLEASRNPSFLDSRALCGCLER